MHDAARLPGERDAADVLQAHLFHLHPVPSPCSMRRVYHLRYAPLPHASLRLPAYLLPQSRIPGPVGRVLPVLAGGRPGCLPAGSIAGQQRDTQGGGSSSILPCWLDGRAMTGAHRRCARGRCSRANRSAQPGDEIGRDDRVQNRTGVHRHQR